MRKLTLSALLILAFSVKSYAAEKTIKECSTTLKHLEDKGTTQMAIKVLAKDDGSVYTHVAQSQDGVSGSYYDVAEVPVELPVRANLTAKSDSNDLNDAERGIVLAMMFSEDPLFAGKYSTGLDLSKVRSAKVFVISKRTHMGYSAIIEAKDANNKVLGSFLGGFLVSACK